MLEGFAEFYRDHFSSFKVITDFSPVLKEMPGHQAELDFSKKEIRVNGFYLQLQSEGAKKYVFDFLVAHEIFHYFYLKNKVSGFVYKETLTQESLTQEILTREIPTEETLADVAALWVLDF